MDKIMIDRINGNMGELKDAFGQNNTFTGCVTSLLENIGINGAVEVVAACVMLHAEWDGRFSRKVCNWAAGQLGGVTADDLKQAYIRYPDEIHPANMDGIATELMRRVTDIPVAIYIPISLNPAASKKICTQTSHETINDYCVEYEAGAAVLKVSSRYNQTKEALKDGFTRLLLLKVAELAM